MVMPQNSPSSRRGVALVIVLSMIVLVTVLVLSFTSNMRLERQVSYTVSENERTKLAADAALAHAISILSTNIPQPAPPVQPVNGVYTQPTPVNWTVNPGLLNLITGPSTVTQIPLSSNPSVSYASTTADANLNQLQASTNQYPIAGSGEPMYVAWIPVLQNPAAAASATNTIASRYAFWIDDENAKINVNTAYGKPTGLDYTKLTPGTITETATSPTNTTDIFPLGHPGSVNLSALGTAVNPTTLLNMLKTRGAAKSPEVIKAAVTSGDPEAFYQQNKFFLTATSRDPEFNAFGKSKLFSYAGQTKVVSSVPRPNDQMDSLARSGMVQWFRDLDAPMYFHGRENRDAANHKPPNSSDTGNPYQDYAAMYYTAANISSILNRRDWPGMPATSFVDKWGGNAAALREADQVAWNLVTMGSFCDFLNDAYYDTAPDATHNAASAYGKRTPGLMAEFGNRIPPDKTGSNGSKNYPNAAVPVGSLSGKAIVPVAPSPMVDEICLNILPEPVSDDSPNYYLQFRASYGVWLPPNYPAADFSQPGCDFFVGLTHLEYTVEQNGAVQCSQASSAYLNNAVSGDGGVKKMQAYIIDSTDAMTPGSRKTVLSIRNVPNPDLTPQFYARNGDGFNSSPVGRASFTPGVVTVTMRMRLFVHTITSPYVKDTRAMPTQLIPVWDTHDPGNATAQTTWNPQVTNDPSSQVYKAFYPPTDDHPPFDAAALGDCVELKFDLDLSQLGSRYCTRSLRIADPRTGGLSRKWMPSWKDAAGNDLPNVSQQDTTDSLGATYNAETQAAISAGLPVERFSYIDMQANTALPHPSVGMFSLVPTGMQRGIPGSTLKLQPSSSAGGLPDWLLLDLFAPTVSPPSTSTAWADIAKMNATAGKLNVNAAIYPSTDHFSPPTRLVPLQALFKSTPAEAAVQNIVDHTLAAGGATYAGGGKFYNYPGEICEIKGVADTGANDWVKEAAVRNLASAITTKSNTFRVWGVAQSVKKLASNHQYSQYEKGDSVTGEKRFEAIVERAVWLGADNVPGNGHVSAGGTYDRLTQGTTQPGAAPSPSPIGAPNPTPPLVTWEKLDGPDAPTYPIQTSVDPNNVTSSADYDRHNRYGRTSYTGTSTDPLESANNPVRTTMKYRVIYFKYLD